MDTFSFRNCREYGIVDNRNCDDNVSIQSGGDYVTDDNAVFEEEVIKMKAKERTAHYTVKLLHYPAYTRVIIETDIVIPPLSEGRIYYMKKEFTMCYEHALAYCHNYLRVKPEIIDIL